MDPSNVFCHNPDCPARGKLGCGNIGIHSRKQRRYICRECGKTLLGATNSCFGCRDYRSYLDGAGVTFLSSAVTSLGTT